MLPYPPPPTPPHTTFVALSAFAAGAPDAWLVVLLAILIALAILFIALWALRGNPIARVNVNFAPARNGAVALIQFLIAIPGILLDALVLYVNADALKSLVRYCIAYPRAVWTVIVVSLIEAIKVIRRRSSDVKNKSLASKGEPIPQGLSVSKEEK